MALDKTLACGEEHPTTAAGCEEDFAVARVPVENPFGSF